ncbi:MAG: tetratricopeptide repeat protein [Methanothrix sp.]|jgi:tetratricopeptide (TPR) repeat protein|uniref:tetratricopeptide repeat protein n=2 Tax=Methanothrix sp. TaxID=90426 RepID=UPI001BD3C8DB|nr:tetratricopeptide repeat protein [Methanothrix sp.]MBK7385842.1 tetratricopeptide repeat protein [Methanothrix sp.]HPW72793.1 tetratricopeptide repeat protein [Methanothrix sp.]
MMPGPRSIGQSRSIPDLLRPGWIRGILMLEMGRAKEAINALDRALAMQPDNLDALTTKAEALTILGRYDVASLAFDQAMDMNSRRYETGDSYVDWRLYMALNYFLYLVRVC